MYQTEIEELIMFKLGFNGRMLSPSKSGYINNHPDGKPIFNANIIVNGDKVWYGDVDLVEDSVVLQDLTNMIGENLYILREMDARFGAENNPKGILEEKAVKTIRPE